MSLSFDERERLNRAGVLRDKLATMNGRGSFAATLTSAAQLADSENLILLLPLLEKLTGQRSPAPDFALTVGLVEYGYQADYYRDGKVVMTECRDFGDNYEIASLVDELVARAEKMIEQFRSEK